MAVDRKKAAGAAGVSALLLAGLGLAVVWWHQPAATGEGPRIGAPAPPLELQDLSGQKATLAQYRGRVVLVDFWATWCANCVEELPRLKGIHADNKPRGFDILGVSMDEEGRRVVLPFIARHGVPWRILMADTASATAYGVSFLPTKILIDRRGLVARKYFGPVDPKELEKDIQSLL